MVILREFHAVFKKISLNFEENEINFKQFLEKFHLIFKRILCSFLEKLMQLLKTFHEIVKKFLGNL